MGEMDDLFRRLPPMARQQTEIGTACQQHRLGMRLPEFQQFVERPRREESAVECRRCGARRRQLWRLDRQPRHLRHRLDDRPVTGAAAEVAGQRFVNRVCIGGLAAGGKGISRHDEARRTEAALRGVGLGHRGLNRMRAAVGPAQTLDRPHRKSVDLSHHRDAGVHRLASRLSIRAVAFEHHGAGPAIALGTALLGAFQAAPLAQPVEQRRHRRDGGKLDRVVVERESNVIRHANRMRGVEVRCNP